MNKKIGTVLLACFVASGVIFWGVKAYIDNKKPDSKIARTRTVYYFHGTKRCYTCNNMEKFTKEAMEKAYPKEVAAGTIQFRSVNVDKPENEHFVTRFNMRGKVVVLTWPDKDGKLRFKKLDKVWTHIRSKDAFITYIQAGMKEFFKI